MERLLSGNEPAPICYSIKDAVRVSGLGRTKLYELMDAGVLANVKIGVKRLIRRDSLEALLAVPAATPGLAPVNSGQGRTVTNVRKAKGPVRASAYRTSAGKGGR